MFYISFENSICDDYVSEKYWDVPLDNNLVPVIFGTNFCVYCVDTYVVVWAQFGRCMYTRILIPDFSVFRTFTPMPINGLNVNF